jgi:proteasome lid subunit RPN8/RPN11
VFHKKIKKPFDFFSRTEKKQGERKSASPPQLAASMKIKREVLALIFEASKSSFPKEFGGLLRREGNVITELIMLPGTLSGEDSAIFNMNMLPIDRSIIGTVHSHPSPYPFPSKADLEFFDKYGAVNIIVAPPFTISSWKAYNSRGDEITLEVVQ